jgi:hypothetical protein
MRTRKPKSRSKGNRNEQAAGKESTRTLGRVVDLLAEYRIKLDALEYVLRETNPPVHELYLGTIENLQAQKTAEVNRVFTRSLKSKLTER